ncbi:glycoprotein [Streptomyces sp. NPDC006733]|uniref:glycoprotein n=1 Tax=Streptomyces sp. NPDC006733 TaxID=3155460 RepID=UPI0033E22AF3
MSGRAPRRLRADIDALLQAADVFPDRDDPGSDLDLDLDGAGGGEAEDTAYEPCRHHRPPPSDAPADAVREPLCVPDCAYAIRQTAARDLHLAVSLVVGDARAADALTRFADQAGAETEGALVFGCLLFLAGHSDAAEYWWQYAAGGENSTAAFCLYLHHRNQGQHRTAQQWRAQSHQLGTAVRPPVPRRPPGSLPLLPGRARRALLTQCHQGASPHLPPAMEAAINTLYGHSHSEEDQDTDAYPLPYDSFPRHLARAANR